MKKLLYKILNKYIYTSLVKELKKDINNELINRIHSVPIAVSNAVYNNMEGDYLEFGVREGNSFILAYKNYLKYSGELSEFDSYKPNWRFFAFDAFDDGFPKSKGKDNEFKPIHWKEGSMKATEVLFKENCKKNKLPSDNVFVIKGYFDETLVDNLYLKYNLRKAAVIHFDCDLYESTITSLNFCTPLIEIGTTLIFDDFFRFKGSELHGQYLAFEQWKAEHPQYKFREMSRYYGNSTVFICSLINL